LIRQKGLALVLVLWVLSLLTIMAGSFALSMRREAAIVAGLKANAQASAIAESGLAIAQMMLLNPDQAKRWRADGSVYQIDYTASNTHAIGSKVRIRLLSEAGKIDINAADPKLLAGLLRQLPIDENTTQRNSAEERAAQLAGAIIDWRDENDEVHVNGAEKKQYQDAGLKYQPRNKPFQTIEELRLLLGMDEATYRWLEPLVTVYSGQPKVNLQQASKDVLQRMPDIDTGLLDDYVAARLQSAINELPPPPLPLGLGQSTATGQANEAVSIIAEALLEDDSSALISTVVKKSDDTTQAAPFQLLKWQDNSGSNASLFTDEMSELLVKQYAEPEFNH
jgi:general secretion pathway protein K